MNQPDPKSLHLVTGTKVKARSLIIGCSIPDEQSPILGWNARDFIKSTCHQSIFVNHPDPNWKASDLAPLLKLKKHCAISVNQRT